MDEKVTADIRNLINADKLNHVGGVSNNLGGVDPLIDETLQRLSGAP